MANFGLLDELLSEPSIWYCQSCNKCNQVCPNIVKPADVITYIRKEMLRKSIVSLEAYTRFSDLFRRFQRVRWHMVQSCIDKNDLSLSKSQWQELLQTHVKPRNGKVSLKIDMAHNFSLTTLIQTTNTLSCFTCSGCSGSCPIFYERGVFDPQWIFRMVNLGFFEELLKSPTIWLCVGCQRCTNNCSQLVKGHLVIQRLRSLAIQEGFVPISFSGQLTALDKLIYPYLLDEVDMLFDFSHNPAHKREK